MTIYSLYKVTNIINNKVYIGFTKRKSIRRWNEHFWESIAQSDECVFHKAIRKYGIGNFNFEVICQSKDGEYLSESMEEYFIRKYGSHYLDGYGYNMTYGGRGFREISDKNRIKIGLNNSKRIWSDESREKSRKSHIGTKHTIEDKYKMSIIQSSDIRRYKSYRITFSGGHIEIVSGLRKFCRDRNYNLGGVNSVKSGKILRHKDIINVELL